MFAVALWDSSRRTLLLARDRAGVKPLYYSIRDSTIFFASEVKSILAAGGSAREIDALGVDQLLTYEYTAGPTTLYTDVHKLPAGGWLTWCEGKVSMGRFWTAGPGEPVVGSEQEVAARVRATVIEAVRRQLVSDVPLGAFLSGGIDSSIMVAAMAQASTDPPKTFSIGFTEGSYDELEHARRVAAHCRHHRRGTGHPHPATRQVIGQLDARHPDFRVSHAACPAWRQHLTSRRSGYAGDQPLVGHHASADHAGEERSRSSAAGGAPGT